MTLFVCASEHPDDVLSEGFVDREVDDEVGCVVEVGRVVHELGGAHASAHDHLDRDVRHDDDCEETDRDLQ